MKRLFWQFLATLMVVGFVLAYWWLIALTIAVVILVGLGPGMYRRYQASAEAERRRIEGLAARADEQHNWVMSGDDR
jgi:hypothetical protein